MYQNNGIMDINSIIHIALVFIIVIVVVVLVINFWVGVQPIKIEKWKRTDKFVLKTFRKLAMTTITKEFRLLRKPTHTQKGAYRVDFLKAVSKKQEKLMNICCSANRFSDNFCDYVNHNYPSASRNQLRRIVVKYVDERERDIETNFNKFVNRSIAITPEEFFDIKSKQSGDVVGVYVIHNETKCMYYVGQAKRLFFRLNQHFTGHGNGDVYADYKYGDDFSIQIIKLSESGYSDLDKLEKDLIKKYDAYNSGYNRTSGNR